MTTRPFAPRWPHSSATVSQADFRRCLEIAAADGGSTGGTTGGSTGGTDGSTGSSGDGGPGRKVDAVLALVLPTAATGDLVTALREADVRVPMAAVVLDQAESVRLLPRAAEAAESRNAQPPVPVYSYPESAAWALSRAASYGAWRSQPRAASPTSSVMFAAPCRSRLRRPIVASAGFSSTE